MKKEYFREYYKKNRDKILLNQKKWREANPGYFKEIHKKWAKRNPDKIAGYKKKWMLKKFGVTSARKVDKYQVHIREHDKEYQKKKRSRLKGYKAEEYRKYKEKNPEKVKAQQKLNYAIRHGRIERSPCEVCGEGRRYHVHAHHDDYSKPLEVRWVCPVHHKLMHK